jgi:hypothetical protein
LAFSKLVVVGRTGSGLSSFSGLVLSSVPSLAVADVDVVDGERVAVHRVDHGLQRALSRTASASDCATGRIVGIDRAVFQAGLQGILQGKPIWLATMLLVS